MAFRHPGLRRQAVASYIHLRLRPESISSEGFVSRDPLTSQEGRRDIETNFGEANSTALFLIPCGCLGERQMDPRDMCQLASVAGMETQWDNRFAPLLTMTHGEGGLHPGPGLSVVYDTIEEVSSTSDCSVVEYQPVNQEVTI